MFGRNSNSWAGPGVDVYPSGLHMACDYAVRGTWWLVRTSLALYGAYQLIWG